MGVGGGGLSLLQNLQDFLCSRSSSTGQLHPEAVRVPLRNKLGWMQTKPTHPKEGHPFPEAMSSLLQGIGLTTRREILETSGRPCFWPTDLPSCSSHPVSAGSRIPVGTSHERQEPQEKGKGDIMGRLLTSSSRLLASLKGNLNSQPSNPGNSRSRV